MVDSGAVGLEGECDNYRKKKNEEGGGVDVQQWLCEFVSAV